MKTLHFNIILTNSCWKVKSMYQMNSKRWSSLLRIEEKNSEGTDLQTWEAELHWDADWRQFYCRWRTEEWSIKSTPPCSIVQRIFHGTLIFCILHHIKLSSTSACGASFTSECTKTQTVSCAWRWMCIKIYHSCFFVLFICTSGSKLSKVTHTDFLRLWLTDRKHFSKLIIIISITVIIITHYKQTFNKHTLWFKVWTRHQTMDPL